MILPAIVSFVYFSMKKYRDRMYSYKDICVKNKQPIARKRPCFVETVAAKMTLAFHSRHFQKKFQDFKTKISQF